MTSKTTDFNLTEHPIFIVGPGRSGTTLMQKILSAHSNITILPETQFIKWADERVNLNDELKNFNSFWKEYTSWIRFEYLGIDADRCLDLINSLDKKTVRNVFRSVLTAYAEKKGETHRIGEKSPSHVRYIPELLSWFPNAKIIVMQRDPRAVISSRLKTPWVQNRISDPALHGGFFINSRTSELILGAKDWKMIFEGIVPKWQSDSRILVLPYEKLVTNPEKEIKSVCSFVGEIYHEEMITNREEENIPEISVGKREIDWKKHHKNTTRPISADSIDKWKKHLTSSEISVIEYMCFDGMNRCGYTVQTSKVNRIKGYLLIQAHISAQRSEESLRRLYRKSKLSF